MASATISSGRPSAMAPVRVVLRARARDSGCGFVILVARQPENQIVIRHRDVPRPDPRELRIRNPKMTATCRRATVR